MNDKVGVKLIDKQLTENQNWLIEWLKKNPYSQITVISHNGNPTEIITKTEDGMGERKIPIALEIIKEHGEPKR